MQDLQCTNYNVQSYLLKLIKMRAELANLNHCAVTFLSGAVVNLSWHYYTLWYKTKLKNVRETSNVASRETLGSILLTKTTAARNGVALSYHSVRGLYFLAVVLVRSII